MTCQAGMQSMSAALVTGAAENVQSGSKVYIILQLMRRQKYVEQKGLTAILTHVKDGGGTLTVHVSEDRAEDLKGLLKEARVPYAEIVHEKTYATAVFEDGCGHCGD